MTKKKSVKASAHEEVVAEPPDDPPGIEMRRFIVRRSEDVSGKSGTGIVAEGCQHTNSWCSLIWFKSPHLKLEWVHSIDAIEKVHGHEGRTVIEFLDGKPGETSAH